MARLFNSRTGYGWVAIALHWLMALAIFAMFGLGLYMVELTYYDRWYRGSLELHKSVGMTLLAVYGLRLGWRLLNRAPQGIGTRFERRAAHLMHLALYTVMLVLMLSGYLISTADGRAIHVFDWFSVPALPWSLANQEDMAGDVHRWLAWTLMTMVALHALAALKHHFINRDRTLKRMLKPNH